MEEGEEISFPLGAHRPPTNRETWTCQTQVLCDVGRSGIADSSRVYRDSKVKNGPASTSPWFLNPSRASSCPCSGVARCPAAIHGSHAAHHAAATPRTALIRRWPPSPIIGIFARCLTRHDRWWGYSVPYAAATFRRRWGCDTESPGL